MLEDWKKWLNSLYQDILAEAAGHPDNPPFRRSPEIERGVRDLQAQGYGEILLRQARWKGRPAVFALAQEADADSERRSGRPGEPKLRLVVVDRWAMDTNGWTPGQIAAWPDISDGRARTIVVPAGATHTRNGGAFADKTHEE